MVTNYLFKMAFLLEFKLHIKFKCLKCIREWPLFKKFIVLKHYCRNLSCGRSRVSRRNFLILGTNSLISSEVYFNIDYNIFFKPFCLLTVYILPIFDRSLTFESHKGTTFYPDCTKSLLLC